MTTFETVRAILVRLDPEGLIKLGAPADEYDGEARQITDALDRGAEPTAELVRSVWERQFCAPDKALPMRQSFEEIAEQIRLELNGDWGVWVTTENWASENGGDDWVGSRTQARERATTWATEPIPDGVRYEPRRYTGSGVDKPYPVVFVKTTKFEVRHQSPEMFNDLRLLLPDEVEHCKGRWTITVTFEPVE